MKTFPTTAQGYLDETFFTQTPAACARQLIGSTLVWQTLRGRVVETEAYAAVGDPACHTFFRPSSRAFVEAGRPGDLYVYLNYGMYWLLNVLVKGPEGDGFVLIRAMEPLAGLDRMRRRSRAGLRDADLASGPGRLTRALGIDGRHHGRSICGLLTRGFAPQDGRCRVHTTPRIGISRGLELEWRFIDPDSSSLSGPRRLNRSGIKEPCREARAPRR